MEILSSGTKYDNVLSLCIIYKYILNYLMQLISYYCEEITHFCPMEIESQKTWQANLLK